MDGEDRRQRDRLVLEDLVGAERLAAALRSGQKAPLALWTTGLASWRLQDFAAGAQTLVPGVHGVPPELHSLEEAQVLRNKRFDPGDFVTGGNHAFCTTRMHGDPTRGVVDELGRCHDLDNLYIADTGIFPRCSAVNPMFTGKALAHRQGVALVDRL